MSLPLWKTDCGCEQIVGCGQKRDRFCEHGRPFVKVRPEDQEPPAPRRRSFGTGGKEPKRDWTDARAKVGLEGCCRVCKTSDRKLEAAHTMGRQHDEPKVNQRTGEILKELYVHPDRVVPLCGPFPEGCHGDFDERHAINLLHYLTLEEQVQAVKDAGGIAPAWSHLAPVDHRAELQSPVKEGTR
ncbi:MAG TPA: hypothetical protein VI039_13075 [Solirubrobacterales bacterium]